MEKNHLKAQESVEKNHLKAQENVEKNHLKAQENVEKNHLKPRMQQGHLSHLSSRLPPRLEQELQRPRYSRAPTSAQAAYENASTSARLKGSGRCPRSAALLHLKKTRISSCGSVSIHACKRIYFGARPELHPWSTAPTASNCTNWRDEVHQGPQLHQWPAMHQWPPVHQ